jgi:hypothetical protein
MILCSGGHWYKLNWHSNVKDVSDEIPKLDDITS